MLSVKIINILNNRLEKKLRRLYERTYTRCLRGNMHDFTSRAAFTESGYIDPLTPPQRLNQLMETYDTFRGENKKKLLLTFALSGFIILNDATLIIQNRLVFRLFSNIFHHLNFPEEHES